MLLHFIHCRALFFFCLTCYSFRCCLNFSQIFRFGYWFVFRVQNFKDLKDLKLCCRLVIFALSFSSHLVLFRCVIISDSVVQIFLLVFHLVFVSYQEYKILERLVSTLYFSIYDKRNFFDFVFFDIWQVAARWLRASCRNFSDIPIIKIHFDMLRSCIQVDWSHIQWQLWQLQLWLAIVFIMMINVLATHQIVDVHFLST